MMQFSLAPWRVLVDQHLTAVLAVVRTRQALLPKLRTPFADAAQTGEPIVRPLAYHYSGYEHVQDQFSPRRGHPLRPSAGARPYDPRGGSLPPGRWLSSDGSVFP
jgi:hypothetical protein